LCATLRVLSAVVDWVLELVAWKQRSKKHLRPPITLCMWLASPSVTGCSPVKGMLLNQPQYDITNTIDIYRPPTTYQVTTPKSNLDVTV